jgi:hypothetical protein
LIRNDDAQLTLSINDVAAPEGLIVNDDSAQPVISIADITSDEGNAGTKDFGFEVTLSVDDVAANEGQSGTTAFNFTVSLSAAGAQPVTVQYACSDGTATTADGDYQAASGKLTFDPGQTTRPVTVMVNGDTKSETQERFLVNLSEATNAAAMPLQRRLLLQAVFSQAANALGYFTGLALYNPTAQTASVTIEVFSAAGVKTGEKVLSLPPGARTSKLLPELAPENASQVGGWVLIKSTQPLVAQQLFGAWDLSMLSAAPPVVVQ